MTGNNPGNQVTGIIVFDLPDDVEPVRLGLVSHGVELRLQ